MAKLIPLAGIYIPDLPRHRGGWRVALQQWNDVDPKTGQALKDWPDEWFKDAMKSKTARKQSQWALIAHKFEQLGGTDDLFLDTHPGADSMRVMDVLEAIQGKNGLQRNSRNGTPQQRYSHGPEPSGVDTD
ncbi:hypothetical protein L208DRAFT_1346357 [Tricholoma matsutake]|nr:hypothetical protein L208DRAFT_1346357 [Tricholoma matsutake 945]